MTYCLRRQLVKGGCILVVYLETDRDIVIQRETWMEMMSLV